MADALSTLKTIDISGWFGSPMQIPEKYRTLTSPSPLPTDQRGVMHSAQRLARIKAFVSAGKFRVAGDVQAKSPAQLEMLKARVARFVAGTYSVPNVLTAQTDTFVDSTGSALLYAATFAYHVGIVRTDALLAKIKAACAALAASTSWDLSRRGSGGGYPFSSGKEVGFIAASYGFARYYLDDGVRLAIEQRLLCCAWAGVGSISDGHVGSRFKGRLAGDYSQFDRGYFDYSYGAGATRRYFWLGADAQGQTVWQSPLTASDMGNQWGQMMAVAGLVAALVPGATELLAHVKRGYMEVLRYGVHGPTCLPAEVGARADDYGYPGQGLVYSSILVHALLAIAGAAAVSLGDRAMLEFTTSMGVMGSEGGPKSLAGVVNALLACRSGKLVMQSAGETPTLGYPRVPVDPKRRYSVYVKDGSEKLHELPLAAFAAMLGLPVNAAAAYRRTGDFAGIALPGTLGSVDCGNDFAGEYTPSMPSDPIPLFSAQDYVLADGGATTAEPPAPSPVPAPVPAAPVPAPVPATPAPSSVSSADIVGMFTLHADAQGANPQTLQVWVTPGQTRIGITGSVIGGLVLKGQSGEADIVLGEIGANGPTAMLYTFTPDQFGIYRAAVGDVQTAPFTVDTAFVDDVRVQAIGDAVVASAAVWARKLVGATLTLSGGASVSMDLTEADYSIPTMQHVGASLHVAPGEYRASMRFDNGQTKDAGWVTVTDVPAAPVPAPEPAPVPAPPVVTPEPPAPAPAPTPADTVTIRRADLEEMRQLAARMVAIVGS